MGELRDKRHAECKGLRDMDGPRIGASEEWRKPRGRTLQSPVPQLAKRKDLELGIVVYTAIYGNKDTLKEPEVKLEGCKLVCFTDDKHLKSKSFDIRVYPSIDSDPTRSAKIFKILPHWFFPDYEYSLWIDGSVIIKRGDIRALVDRYLREHNIAFFAHPDRACIYEEAETCIALQCDQTAAIRQQMEQYRSEGYPPHNGLVATGIVLRRHSSPCVIRADEDWWAQILRFSRRDQLSFNYVAWKNDLRYATIEGRFWDNDYFRITSHRIQPLPV